VKPDSEVDWILSFILGDPQGADIACRIDATIAKLPGLHWFDRLSSRRDEALLQVCSRSDGGDGRPHPSSLAPVIRFPFAFFAISAFQSFDRFR